jgi:hypothetical protein
MGSRKQCGVSASAALFITAVGTNAQLRPQAIPQTTKSTEIVIQTSPNAEVYRDDSCKGQANAQGRLVIDNFKAGKHALIISRAGKKDYEHQVKVMTGEVGRMNAALADIPKPEVPKPASAAASSRVVDLLAVSSAEALAGWLTAQPGVTTISRDRRWFEAQ